MSLRPTSWFSGTGVPEKVEGVLPFWEGPAMGLAAFCEAA